MNRRTNIILGVSAGIMLILAAVVSYFTIFPGAPEEAMVYIPHGATDEMVRDTLVRHFGENYSNKVMRLAEMQGFEASSRSGAYRISKGMSPLMASRKIARGAQQPVKVTINGFRSREAMVKAIAAKFEFSPEALDSALSDPRFLASYGMLPSQAMAIFLNDTYEFYWNTSPSALLKKIADTYKHFWTPERTAKARELGLTPVEAAIISSIVDEETNYAPEKGTIGRLYINRLNKGMRLQADPTVRFAIGDFNIRRISSAHLQTKSPYNTYRVAGLPPGPIRTISRATLDSILNSSPVPYLYMCARPDFSGRHDFSVTFDEHKANASAYRAELDRRGISE